jgi:3-dehydroquinate dehydratase
MANSLADTIYVLNGPNLNLLGTREPETYGHATLADVEVHISNNHARENFRQNSFTARAAFATLCGFGIDGYRLAIHGLAARIGVTAKA